MFPQKQIQDIVRNNSTIVKVNEGYSDEKELPIMITNSALNPNSSYHIHSLEYFRSGDMFSLEGERYLCRVDTVLKRHAKYKATVDYCNYPMPLYKIVRVQVGVDEMNRPIYKDEEVFQKIEYGILEEVKILKTDNNQPINNISVQYTFTIRDNELNKEIFTLNREFTIKGYKLKVTGFNYLRSGIMVVTLSR
ncbi:hypothetical protein D3C79_845800 [compost metagenome]